MSPIDNILLYSLLYFMFWYYDVLRQTSSVSGNTKKILKFSCLLSFIFVEGLRYGRGRDYFHYGDMYLRNTTDTEQPLFELLQNVVHYIDITIGFLPYGICYIVYALIFVCCLFKFSTLFYKTTSAFLLLAILATQYITEWTIRQGISFSFVLIALYFLERNKKKECVVNICIALGFHYANFFLIGLIFICKFLLNKTPVSLKLSIPCLLITTFILKSENSLPYIASIVSIFDLSFLGEGFSHYTNSERWFSENGILVEMQRSLFTTILTTIFYISVFVVGYFYHLQNKKWIYIYNLYVISVLLYTPFYLVEILARILYPGTVFWFIPLSLSLHEKKKLMRNKYLLWALYCIILYLLTYYGRFVFMHPTASFIWSMKPTSFYF